MVNIEEEVAQAVDALDFAHVFRTYHEQNEFIVLDHFFSLAVVSQFLSEVDDVRPQIHRNYIPKHKKGGSVSYYLLRQKAAAILSFYRAPAFIDLLSRLAGARLLLCPDEDPHACALYFYTEPGDHIGFHYDTSYYKGARYTVLLGLVDQSSSRLVCRLHTRDSGKETKELNLSTDPGSLIIFNGNKLYHAVTPLGAGEERIVLTLQYVTNPSMGPFRRFMSNMKDAIAYFGPAALFRRNPSKG